MNVKRVGIASMLLILAVAVLGCSGMTIDQFEDGRPQFDPLVYFDGTVHAWGTFEGRSGDVKRQFEATFTGRRKGDQVTMDEAIRYKNGDTEARSWSIEMMSDSQFKLSTDNMVSPPSMATVKGNAMAMTYRMDIGANGNQVRLQFDDWMMLQDRRTMISRASISKWGINLGTVHIFYRKNSPPESQNNQGV